MVLHSLEEIKGASNVIIIVAERLFDRFGDGLEPGKMDDEVEMGAGEDVVKGVGVEEVDFVKTGSFACDLLDFVENLDLAIYKIVEDFDCVTLI